jgi:hypothetical protein
MMHIEGDDNTVINYQQPEREPNWMPWIMLILAAAGVIVQVI